jgi:hypothetical protein
MAVSVPFPYARYTEQVWNSHNPEALAQFVAADARVHSMTPGVLAGAGLDYLKGRAQVHYSTPSRMCILKLRTSSSRMTDSLHESP